MTTVQHAGNGPDVTLLGLGEFGKHVVALLGRSSSWRVMVTRAIADAYALDSRAVIAAMWRPSPALCEEADALAFQHQRPWLPVVMDHPHVRVGPVVVPGGGACFACFTARYEQHDPQYDATAALYAAYDRDPSFGPRGYLDHHARLAAALAEMALGDISTRCMLGAAAQVLTFNLYRGDIRRHPVIARSDCTRCSITSAAGSQHAISDLLRGIAARRAEREPDLRTEKLETAHAQ
jgi:bacteriocin biosynthesis cyclodehydratase domain-containing protein